MPVIGKEDNQFAQGLSLFWSLSGWLVGPIIVALFLGRFLDARYSTRPWLFLVCLGLAFVFTSFGIVRETFKYIKQIEKEYGRRSDK